MAQYSHGLHTILYSEGPSFIPVYFYSEQEHKNESATVICTDFCSQCHLLYVVMQVKYNLIRNGEKDGQGKFERPFSFTEHTFSR